MPSLEVHTLEAAIVDGTLVRIRLLRSRGGPDSAKVTETIEGVPRTIVRGRNGEEHLSIEIGPDVSRVVPIERIAKIEVLV